MSTVRLRKCTAHENCVRAVEDGKVTHAARGAWARSRFGEFTPSDETRERGMSDGLMLEAFRRFEDSKVKDLQSRMEALERKLDKAVRTLNDRIDMEVEARVAAIRKLNRGR